MSNPFVYVELSSTDLSKSKSFYNKLFEWKLEDSAMGEPPYTNVVTGNTVNGGMLEKRIPDGQSAWITYVNVDDVNGMTKKAVGLGATVVKEVTPVKDMGWFSIITDPTGATIGLWQSI